MAERYGEIPKRFTKKWWEYFWDYYKIHTIVTIFAIAMIALLIYQQVTKIHYDMNITYVSDLTPDENYSLTLQDNLSDTMADINDDGEKHIYLNQYVFNDKYKDEEFTSAIITGFQYEFLSEKSMLFVFSKEKSDYLFKNANFTADAFLTIDQWLDSDIDKEMMLYSNGKPYGVSLSNSAINPDEKREFFVAIRKPLSYDKEGISDSFKNIIEVANAMISLKQ